MPRKDQVTDLLARGLSWGWIGWRLGIPAGQAYLIGTGAPADGGRSAAGTEPDRAGGRGSAQHLLGPPTHDPGRSESVRSWMRARAAADPQMRAAADRGEA